MQWLPDRLRFWLLERLIRFYWWIEWVLELCPHYKQREGMFFVPLWAVSLIVSAASFAANMAISYLLAPRQKPQVKGKLTGEITLTDSVYGAPLPRIYGSRDAGTPGGVEVGSNIMYMSDIRVFHTQAPSGGGGGKGAPKPPPNIQVTYKVDLAGAVGAGRLRLLRMKWNEDTVYSIIGGGPGGGGTIPDRYEAEDPDNTLSGGASVANDNQCSNDQKVTGIGAGGVLIINDIQAILPSSYGDDPPQAPERYPWFRIVIHYKAVGDLLCNVLFDGVGGVRTFQDTGGNVGIKELVEPHSPGPHTLEFSYPDAAGPEIDCIDVSIIYLTLEPSVTGVLDELFPAEPPQDNILLPDPYQKDTNAYERYNGPTPEAVNGLVEIPIQGGASLAWYEGTATQDVDPVIDAAVTALYGPGNTPAFRDTAYFRIQNLDFTEYGSIPAIRVVVENIDLQTVEEILLFEGTAVGLQPSDFDLTAAADLHVRGYYVQENSPPASVFEDLGLLHNLSFAENHDGKVVTIDLDDRTPVATITRADLAAYVAEQSDEVPLNDVVSTIPEESEDLVRTLEFQFNNPLPPSDFSTDRRTFNYPFTASRRKETKSIPATMLPEEAAAVVRRELQKMHLKQAPEQILVPHKFAWINAGDCLNLEIDGQLHLRRVEEKTGSVPGVYEMTLTNEEIYVMADDGTVIEDAVEKDEKRLELAVTVYPANTIGTIMDIPPLRDQDKGVPGVYVAARSKGSGEWKGCQVMRHKAGSYQPMVAITKEATMGVVVGVLPAPGVGGGEGLLDPVNEVTVDFYGDYNPSTVTNLQAEDGANAYVIGKEVCVVQTWTRDNNYPNRWVGSDIYRGNKDTFDKTSSHVDGERVVLLDDAVRFVPLNEEEIGVARDWKFVTYGARVEDSAVISYTWTGDNANNLEKNAPVIGQVLDSEQLSIRIGVRGYTSKAKYRKIEVSPNSNMSAAEIVIVSADEFPSSYLPAEFLLTRASGNSALTRYVRVSHSSNDRVYSTASNILTVTFADSSGAGGTSGGFSPIQDYKVETT